MSGLELTKNKKVIEDSEIEIVSNDSNNTPTEGKKKYQHVGVNENRDDDCVDNNNGLELLTCNETLENYEFEQVKAVPPPQLQPSSQTKWSFRHKDNHLHHIFKEGTREQNEANDDTVRRIVDEKVLPVFRKSQTRSIHSSIEAPTVTSTYRRPAINSSVDDLAAPSSIGDLEEVPKEAAKPPQKSVVHNRQRLPIHYNDDIASTTAVANVAPNHHFGPATLSSTSSLSTTGTGGTSTNLATKPAQSSQKNSLLPPIPPQRSFESQNSPTMPTTNTVTANNRKRGRIPRPILPLSSNKQMRSNHDEANSSSAKTSSRVYFDDTATARQSNELSTNIASTSAASEGGSIIPAHAANALVHSSQYLAYSWDSLKLGTELGTGALNKFLSLVQDSNLDEVNYDCNSNHAERMDRDTRKSRTSTSENKSEKGLGIASDSGSGKGRNEKRDIKDNYMPMGNKRTRKQQIYDDSVRLSATQTLQIVNSLRPKTCLPPRGSKLHFVNKEKDTTELYCDSHIAEEDENVGINKKKDETDNDELQIPFQTLEKLYQTMCSQDSDDGTSARREAHYLPAKACIDKLHSVENKLCELKLRQMSATKVAKKLGLLDATRMETCRALGFHTYDENFKIQ